MTRAGTERRLRRLERQEEGESRLVVVDGFSAEEHDAKISELEQRGGIGPRDIVVCVAKFAEPTERRAGVLYFCDEIKYRAETLGNSER